MEKSSLRSLQTELIDILIRHVDNLIHLTKQADWVTKTSKDYFEGDEAGKLSLSLRERAGHNQEIIGELQEKRRRFTLVR